MRILIKSRVDIEAKSKIPFEAHTAIISISDADTEFAELTYKPDYLLQIAFDDVDNDIFIDELGREPTAEEREHLEKKYNMITDSQAIAIATFYYEHKDEISNLICQCEHGQSRSAAVAASVMEFRSRRGIAVFASDKYYPNKVVYRKVYSALKGIVERKANL